MHLQIQQGDTVLKSVQGAKLSSLVRWVKKSKLNYTEDHADVFQYSKGEQPLFIPLEEVMETYELGETPEDLYFF